MTDVNMTMNCKSCRKGRLKSCVIQ